MEVWSEHRLGGLEGLGADRGLSPTNHLCVEPRRLHWIRTRGAFPANQQILVAFANGAVGSDLEAAVQGSQDDIRIDPNAFRLGQNMRRLGSVMRNEFGGAKCRPDQRRKQVRILSPTSFA